jgi:hypothetical protein
MKNLSRNDLLTIPKLIDNVKNRSNAELYQLYTASTEDTNQYALNTHIQSYNIARTPNAAEGSSWYNKNIAHIIAPYKDCITAKRNIDDSQFIKMAQYARGGLMASNPLSFGYHKHVNGHACDISSAYPWALCGKVPFGRIHTGQGPIDCCQFISYTFDDMELKPEYKLNNRKIIPMFRFAALENCEPYVKDGKWQYAKASVNKTATNVNKISNNKAWYHDLANELADYQKIYTFSNLRITYDYWYEMTDGIFDAPMKQLYSNKLSAKGNDKCKYKNCLCVATGNLKANPTRLSCGSRRATATHSATYCYMTWKVRSRIRNTAIYLYEHGNTVTHITTDCIYWVGNTPTEVIMSLFPSNTLGSWQPYGDGMFNLKDGTSSKRATIFDEYYLSKVNLYCLNLKGHRTKTSKCTGLDKITNNELYTLPPEKWAEWLADRNLDEDVLNSSSFC